MLGSVSTSLPDSIMLQKSATIPPGKTDKQPPVFLSSLSMSSKFNGYSQSVIMLWLFLVGYPISVFMSDI
jgi:hypothetical protein